MTRHFLVLVLEYSSSSKLKTYTAMQVKDFYVKPLDERFPAILLDNGEWYFAAQTTCVFAELTSKNNASKWVRNNIPSKWVIQLKVNGKANGRPGTYLSEAGFFYAVCQGRSEKALTFRDWVFEVLLPKLRSDVSYQDVVTKLREKNEILEKKNNQLEEEKQKAIEAKLDVLLELDDPITGHPLIFSEYRSNDFEESDTEEKATISRDDLVYQLRVKVGATNSRNSKAYEAVLEVLKETKLISEYCSNSSPTS